MTVCCESLGSLSASFPGINQLISTMGIVLKIDNVTRFHLLNNCKIRTEITSGGFIY